MRHIIARPGFVASLEGLLQLKGGIYDLETESVGQTNGFPSIEPLGGYPTNLTRVTLSENCDNVRGDWCMLLIGQALGSIG